MQKVDREIFKSGGDLRTAAVNAQRQSVEAIEKTVMGRGAKAIGISGLMSRSKSKTGTVHIQTPKITETSAYEPRTINSLISGRTSSKMERSLKITGQKPIIDLGQEIRQDRKPITASKVIGKSNSDQATKQINRMISSLGQSYKQVNIQPQTKIDRVISIQKPINIPRVDTRVINIPGITQIKIPKLDTPIKPLPGIPTFPEPTITPLIGLPPLDFGGSKNAKIGKWDYKFSRRKINWGKLKI